MVLFVINLNIMVVRLLRRLRALIIILSLAVLWILLDAHPTLAQESSVNYTYSEIRGQDFSHKNLVGAVFAAADARGANFEFSDLSNSILTKAVFSNANLTAVNLTKSLMDRVALDGTNLTNAILQDAVATSTNFDGATITGADFSGAILDRYQTYLLCQRAEGTNSTTGVATRDSLGCR
jgi:uncharacterized protein YjbI with pentapeptide repeats